MKKNLLKKLFSKKVMAMVLSGITVASCLTPAMAAETTRGTVSWKSVSQGINSSNQYVYDGNKTDFSLTGRILSKGDSKGYIENGKVNASKNGLLPALDGWYLITNGWVNTSYSSLKWISGDNYYSFKNGKLVMTDNRTVLKLDDGSNSWWYVTNGKIDKSFTGFAANENGIWRVESGKVNFDYTGIWYDKNSEFSENAAYLYFKNGKLDTSANTVAKNENGWWKITNGQVDFKFTGLAKNDNGWWYIKNGRVPGVSDVSGQPTFEGAVENSNGIWYVKGSKVQMWYSKDNPGYTGTAYGFRFVNGKAQ